MVSYRKMLEKTILFDLCHNEMLNIEEEEFSEFKNFLLKQGFKIKVNKTENLTKTIIGSVEILVIGNPINDYFSNQEIKTLCDYVRIGGSLLLTSEYGADFLQKTNLNDLSGKHFGIFFEKNLIKQSIEGNDSSIIKIQDFRDNKFSNGLRELAIGGTCSFFLNKEAKILLRSNKNGVWSEIFNNSKESWIKQKQQEQILGAYAEYGQGKIIALGDVDIFTNDNAIGIKSYDNQIFLQNCINWLIRTVDEPNVMKFILNQVGKIQNDMKEMNNVINNIIETITILEKRISYMEKKLSVSNLMKNEEQSINSKAIEKE